MQKRKNAHSFHANTWNICQDKPKQIYLYLYDRDGIKLKVN